MYWRVLCVLLDSLYDPLVITLSQMIRMEVIINVVKMRLSILDRGMNVKDTWLLSWLLSTQIPMKIRQCPIEMKNIIFLLGRVLSGCLLPSITLFERMFSVGDTKAGNKQRDGVVSLSKSFSLLVQVCCSHHPEWAEETHPSGKATSFRHPVIYLGTNISNLMFHLASLSDSFKISADRQCNREMSLMVSSLLYLQVASGTCESGTYSGRSLFLSLVRSNNLILGSQWNEDHKCEKNKNKNKKKSGKNHRGWQNMKYSFPGKWKGGSGMGVGREDGVTGW